MSDAPNETPAMSMSTRLYPWPLGGDEVVTRDYLARHFAEQSQLYYGSLDEFPTGSTDWRQSVAGVTFAFACCLLLQNLPDETADYVARILVDDLNDGGSCSELTWQWLHDWGMDPDAIHRRGQQLARDQLSKASALDSKAEL